MLLSEVQLIASMAHKVARISRRRTKMNVTVSMQSASVPILTTVGLVIQSSQTGTLAGTLFRGSRLHRRQPSHKP